jgi:hypothetical protein
VIPLTGWKRWVFVLTFILLAHVALWHVGLNHVLLNLLIGIVPMWITTPWAGRKKPRRCVRCGEEAPHRVIAPTIHKGDKLNCYELGRFRLETKCPDCGEQNLQRGPSGGFSENLLCGNEYCGSRFNEMGVFGIERISEAQPRRKYNSPRGDYR